MNTDNMSIAGETIDYGPCAFMDAYDPATVFSSIDHAGRYAYGNQPRDRPLEPRAAGGDVAAAAGGSGRRARTVRTGCCGRHWCGRSGRRFRARGARGVRPPVPGGVSRRPAAQDRPGRRARGRFGADQGPDDGDGGNGADFTLTFRRAVRRVARTGGGCRRAVAVHEPRRLRRLGGAVARAAGRGAHRPGGAQGRDARDQPGRDPPQPHRRGGAGSRRDASGLRAVRGVARRAVATVRGQART